MKKVYISLRISEIIYWILGLGFFIIALVWEDSAPSITLIIIGFMGIGIAILINRIIKNLKEKKYWAWVTAVILSAIYLPSLFLPLGIIQLMGLLNKENRDSFLNKDHSSPSPSGN